MFKYRIGIYNENENKKMNEKKKIQKQTFGLVYNSIESLCDLVAWAIFSY